MQLYKRQKRLFDIYEFPAKKYYNHVLFLNRLHVLCLEKIYSGKMPKYFYMPSILFILSTQEPNEIRQY